jgi:hypothetical protein
VREAASEQLWQSMGLGHARNPELKRGKAAFERGALTKVFYTVKLFARM